MFFNAAEIRCPLMIAAFVAAGFAVLAMWVALETGRGWMRATAGLLATTALLPAKAYSAVTFLLITASITAVVLVLAQWTAKHLQRDRPAPNVKPGVASRQGAGWHKRFEFWMAVPLALSLLSLILRNRQRVDAQPGWPEILLYYSLLQTLLWGLLVSIGNRLRTGRRPRGVTTNPMVSFRLRDLLTATSLLAWGFAMVAFCLRIEPISNWRVFGIMMVWTLTCQLSVGAIAVSRRTSTQLFSILIIIATFWIAFITDRMMPPGEPTLVFAGQPVVVPVLNVTLIYCVMLLSMTTCIHMLGGFGSRHRSGGTEATVATGHWMGMLLLITACVCVGPIYWNMITALPTATPGNSPSTDRPPPTANHLRTDVIVEPRDGTSLADWTQTIISTSDVLVKQNQFDRAAETLLDGMKVFSRLSQAGPLRERLDTIDLECELTDRLIDIRNELSTDTLGDLIEGLVQIDQSRDSTATMKGLVRQHTESRLGWQFRLQVAAASYLTQVSPDELRTPDQMAFASLLDTTRRRDVFHRLILTDLSIHLFMARHRRQPEDLDELVPEILPGVPRDPYLGVALRYQPADDRYLLYSVGCDGRDDHGRAAGRGGLVRQGLDLNLDGLNATPAGGSGMGGMGGGLFSR